jgi:membrane dipeptidase
MLFTRYVRIAALLAMIAAPALVATQSGTSVPEVTAQARQLHTRAIVIDSHDDTTQRLVFEKNFDLGVRHENGNIDLPRMRDGGLDALFFSIWVPSDVTGPPAVKRAMDQIDAVREAVRRRPDELMLATTADEIRRAVAEHKIAALMGMEGGHMIDDDLRLLRDYAALGVRYLTLTHFKNNTWADSSTDKPAHNGLTAFGKDVVRELNRLGVLVDISHVADKTFYDTIAVAKAPVIASHSSARALTNHPRNMTDDMLRAVAKNGGVVQVNFYNAFIDEDYRKAAEAQAKDRDAAVKAYGDQMKAAGKTVTYLDNDRIEREWAAKIPRPPFKSLIDHIDHIAKVAGVDHVGLGSDFDGVSGATPQGIDSAADLPKITQALLDRGYSADDIRKILGGNLLRVFGEAERVSRELQSAASPH